MKGLLITGTDTGVGKTYIAALIARSLIASGLQVGVYKPAASGCMRDAAGGLTFGRCGCALGGSGTAGRP